MALATYESNLKGTQDRYDAIHQYLHSEWFRDQTSPGTFTCEYYLRGCKASVAASACYSEPKPSDCHLNHQGEDYDGTVNGKPLRILFVGIDTGRGSDAVGLLRTDRYGLNDHYRGILKVLMEIFQVRASDDEQERLQVRSLLRRCAQTNTVQCCAPSGGRMGTNSTDVMRENCWRYLKKEIEILEPTLILFHGARVRDPFTESIGREGLTPTPIEGLPECETVRWTVFPNPFTSLLAFFHHPARGHFGKQWPRVVYLLGRFRSQYAASFQDGWTPLGRREWPGI
ncbi:MAG TPA: uracil-DNA glycosylase family protein [Terriglobia bacterium]|nr:uracil-DNA glycosylase family protein [Terriglobia bacterium]